MKLARETKKRLHLPNRNDFSERKIDRAKLSNEKSGDSFVQSGAVHVDLGADWNDESRYPGIQAQFVQGLYRQGQSRGTRTKNKNNRNKCALSTNLDAVPKAVTKTWLREAMNRNGSVLVQTKKITASEPKPCNSNPSRTVTKYIPRAPTKSLKLSVLRIFSATKKNTPIGDILFPFTTKQTSTT